MANSLSAVAVATVVRPFSASDPYNTPIPSNPALDPNSSQWISQLAPHTQWSNLSDTADWGIPVYQAAASDPVYTMPTLTSYHVAPVHWQVRIPADAQSSRGSDHIVEILEPDGHTDVDFWGFQWVGGRPTAAMAWETDYGPTGSSINPTVDGISPGIPIGALAGLVLPGEIAQGHIDHALSIATPTTGPGRLYPFVGHDGPNPGGIPEGARIQIDPSFNVAAQKWPRWLKVIAVALQRYGAYVTNTSGSLEIYGEAPQTANWLTVGVPDQAALAALPWAQMRVLAPAASHS